MTMTQVELIKSIGDVLRTLDLLKRNQPASESTNPAIEELRNKLARQQLRLAINHFEPHPTAFLQETREIKEIINAFYGALQGTDEESVFKHLRRLAKAVDSLIGNINS